MLGLTINMADLRAGMTRLERRQVPIATVWALNDTADDVLDHIKTRMDVVFDKPTRFTKNAFMLWRATKQTLTAEVRERPSVGSKHYLKIEETGGRRPATGLERLLTSRLDYDGVIAAVTPASGARLNAFGNWTPGERNRVLAAIQGQGDGRAGASRSPRGGRRGRAGYFVPRPGSRLSPGVWKRKRGGVEKVLHFTSVAPTYDKRLGFYDGAEDVWTRAFPGHFAQAFEKALRTAR